MHRFVNKPAAFAALGILPQFNKALDKMGFEQPTDIQREMIIGLLKRLDRHGAANAHPMVGDATSLPLADDSVDAAFLVTVLGEIPDRPRALRELRRVLKPGGRFALVTMGKPPHDDLGARLMQWLMPQAKLYHDEELARMLEDAGFREVEAYSPGGGTQVGYGVKA